MTVLLKHLQEKGRDEMIFKNGRNTVKFNFYKDKGENGWAFEVYKGQEHLAGFNVLGNRISGPYALKGKPIEVSGFDDKDSPYGRYAYVENDLGVMNNTLFVAEGRPFKYITFCDSDGHRAIDIHFDEAGKLVGVSRSRFAHPKEDTFVNFENLDNPKLNKQMQLGGRYDGAYYVDEKVQNKHLLNRLKSGSNHGGNFQTPKGNVR